MNEKGELTSKQIIGIVILIVSFAVILIFFFALNLRSEINSETCRNSVILRGTALGKNTKLNCQTEDVCFSRNGECDIPVDRVIEVDTKRKFLDEATDLMYNCYWQMGSGEVDYTPTNFGSDKKYCAICDRVYFDSSLEGSEIIKVSNKELYSHLKGRRVPNGENNMLFEIYGVNDMGSVFANDALQPIADAPVFFDNKVLVTSLTKEGWGGALFTGAGGLVAGGVIGAVAVAATPFTAGGSLVAGGAAIGAIVGAGGGVSVGLLVSGPGGEGQMLPPTYYSNKPEVLEELKCYEFSTLS